MAACGRFVSGYYSPDRDNPTSEHWVELRTAYPCSVDVGASGNHEGPCAAVEQPQTVSARQRWLEADRRRQEDLRHASSGLGGLQERPLTFSENVGADPAVPHPGQEVGCPLCPLSVTAKDLPEHLRQYHSSTVPTVIHTAPPHPAPTKAGREHDQDLPQPNMRPVMHEVLINYIQSRLAIGIERYGTGLQPMNGRDAYRDLVEELIDATVYTLQIQHERAEMLDHAVAIYEFFELVNGQAQVPGEKIPVDMREHIQALVNWLEAPSDHTAG